MTAREIPLTMAAAGKPLRVVRVNAGGDLTRRLADLGLTPGVQLRRLDPSEAWSVDGVLHVGRFRRFFGGRSEEERADRPGPGAGKHGHGFFGGRRRRLASGGCGEGPGPGGGPFAPGKPARGPEPGNAEPAPPGSERRGRGWHHRPRLGRSRRDHPHAGGVVVELRGSKLVLGYGVGEKIVVAEEQEEGEPRPDK